MHGPGAKYCLPQHPAPAPPPHYHHHLYHPHPHHHPCCWQGVAGWTAICMELSAQLPQHLFKTNLSHSGHTHYPHPQNPSKQSSHPQFYFGRQAELNIEVKSYLLNDLMPHHC